MKSPGAEVIRWKIIPLKVCDEMASLTPLFAGVSFDRLEDNGLQWPVVYKDHPGTPVVHLEKFIRGLGKFIPVSIGLRLKFLIAGYPFILTTGGDAFSL